MTAEHSLAFPPSLGNGPDAEVPRHIIGDHAASLTECMLQPPDGDRDDNSGLGGPDQPDQLFANVASSPAWFGPAVPVDAQCGACRDLCLTQLGPAERQRGYPVDAGAKRSARPRRPAIHPERQRPTQFGLISLGYRQAAIQVSYSLC